MTMNTRARLAIWLSVVAILLSGIAIALGVKALKHPDLVDHSTPNWKQPTVQWEAK